MGSSFDDDDAILTTEISNSSDSYLCNREVIPSHGSKVHVAATVMDQDHIDHVRHFVEVTDTTIMIM
jgi:hypothetical protein